MTLVQALDRRLAGVSLAGGRREELKWLAAGLMVLDHVNGYLLDLAYPVLYALGRLAFPIFAMVLAWNLAEAGEGAKVRVLKRLLLVGLLAQPFTMLLRYPLMPGIPGSEPVWWQGNVLFTFAVGVGVVLALGREAKPGAQHVLVAALLFVVGGLLVDFRWAGVGFFVSAYCLFVQRSSTALLVFLAANLALAVENGTGASLFALGCVAAAFGSVSPWRRRGGLFYWFYLAQLSVVWGIQAGGY
ncbi:MAG: TraX family protein [Burkholderiales bacterium]|jgi:hypothetical protein|nr:TraX family protein [Burkholderiales bacterium]